MPLCASQLVEEQVQQLKAAARESQRSRERDTLLLAATLTALRRRERKTRSTPSARGAGYHNTHVCHLQLTSPPIICVLRISFVELGASRRPDVPRGGAPGLPLAAPGDALGPRFCRGPEAQRAPSSTQCSTPVLPRAVQIFTSTRAGAVQLSCNRTPALGTATGDPCTVKGSSREVCTVACSPMQVRFSGAEDEVPNEVE